MWQNWTYMKEEMLCGFLGVIYVQEVGFLSFWQLTKVDIEESVPQQVWEYLFLNFFSLL